MEVRVETVIPGVQDHDTAQLAPELLLPKLLQGLTGGGEQEGDKLPFVAEEQGVEVVRKRKHGVKGGDGEELRLAGFDPWGRGEALTLGTVPIAAGVVDSAREAAWGTLLGVAPSLGRATGRDSLQDLLLGR